MKVLICNPEESEAIKLQKQIETFSERAQITLETFVFLNPVDAAASKIRFDIAVIEAGMEDLSGITLGKILVTAIPYIKLIFTSSQSKNLDAAFDVNAVRFLKRPYSQARFLSGLKEAIRRVDSETICFDFKDGNDTVRVCKSSIMYIEIENRKTKIITEDNTYYSKNPMTYWKEHLHSVKFLSPHKSYLINTDYIEKYKRNQYVVMNGGSTISIARGKGALFHRSYTAYKSLML